MKFLIIFTAVISFACNMFAQETSFAYNPEIKDQVVLAKTVYKKDNTGLFLTRHLKYEYSYDHQKRLVRKEALKWNDLSEQWEKSHCYSFHYNDGGYSVEFARWNRKINNYADVIEKCIYYQNENMLFTVQTYKRERNSDEWKLKNECETFHVPEGGYYAFHMKKTY